MLLSIAIACLSSALAAYSESERCGTDNSGLLCDPQGQFGPCCSQGGYCGNTTAYCSVSSGCQSGCVNLPPPPPEPTPAGCGDGFCDGRSETCTNCVQDCGKCNLPYLDKCITPGHVALSFDDGPDDYGLDLLAAAQEANVKPIHFVIGNKLSNVTYQNYLKQYYAAGHAIGSHTFTHPYITKMTSDQLRQEMIKTDDVIFSLIGVRPIFMRNPYSDTDDRTMAVLQSMGYKSIFTSLDAQDTVYTDPSKILASVATGLQADPTVTPYVITQHETLDVSINLLPQIVQMVRQRNYTIVPIDTCFGTTGVYRNDVCGDGKCSGYIENCATCPQDCGACPGSSNHKCHS